MRGSTFRNWAGNQVCLPAQRLTPSTVDEVAAIVERAPWVDVVFGTHNIGSLPVLLDRARHNAEAQVEILESRDTWSRIALANGREAWVRSSSLSRVLR